MIEAQRCPHRPARRSLQRAPLQPSLRPRPQPGAAPAGAAAGPPLPRALALLLLLTLACSNNGTTQEPACTEATTRCFDNTFQTCRDGVYRDTMRCSAQETCDVELLCLGQGSCGAGGDLIYAIDSEYELWAFNPRNGVHRFKSVGVPRCPAGAPWPPAQGMASPNSMSVDRTGRAWVSYNSGELFQVSTKDARCTKTAFEPGQLGFKLFGMGFVSDLPDPTAETLFLTALGENKESGPLGRLDGKTLRVQVAGTLPPRTYSPELTGTGAGELYGYYPDPAGALVARIDKATGKHVKEWPLPPVSGTVDAYAFAHWGGRFYIFLTTLDDKKNFDSQVLRFDPATGAITPILSKLPMSIVGAGVSTCAPVILG